MQQGSRNHSRKLDVVQEAANALSSIVGSHSKQLSDHAAQIAQIQDQMAAGSKLLEEHTHQIENLDATMGMEGMALPDSSVLKSGSTKARVFPLLPLLPLVLRPLHVPLWLAALLFRDVWRSKASAATRRRTRSLSGTLPSRPSISSLTRFPLAARSSPNPPYSQDSGSSMTFLHRRWRP
mmetsp:Transcript_24826/g.68159  ORF Transcript_24826/g.68159 Transcript_24826/m.68159 type:complete len:180 (+) Transcript_24826:592-1131(+)